MLLQDKVYLSCLKITVVTTEIVSMLSNVIMLLDYSNNEAIVNATWLLKCMIE